jgi:ribosomal protein S18 acetylase RimI-like enzyme
MTDVPIRPASESDAEQIGLVHVRSWQGAYHGLMPQEYLDALDPSRRAAGWRGQLRDLPARASVLVAPNDATISGFVAFGPTRDDDSDPDKTGEVFAIYTLPEAWSTGTGRRLMSAAVKRLTADGFTDAMLWVLDSNARARGFYAKAGWVPDGATKTDGSRGFPITEVRYRRSLA